MVLLGCLQPAPTTEEEPVPEPGETTRAVFVGNNWEGTADILLFDPESGFQRVARLDIIPDIEERMMEILTDPERLVFFLGIRLLVGEGNDQFVDDMYSTPDGRNLIVSRPSLRDVVSLDIETGEIAWRFVVDGQRSDHMAISPDGRHVAVSASTGNVVHILDTATGQEVGRLAVRELLP
jgi:WD40 repeat protein